MELRVRINCDNAAFTDDLGEECRRILLKIGAKLVDGENRGRCMDYNGNTVGEWELVTG
jgi:hypothetical protein